MVCNPAERAANTSLRRDRHSNNTRNGAIEPGSGRNNPRRRAEFARDQPRRNPGSSLLNRRPSLAANVFSSASRLDCRVVLKRQLRASNAEAFSDGRSPRDASHVRNVRFRRQRPRCRRNLASARYVLVHAGSRQGQFGRWMPPLREGGPGGRRCDLSLPCASISDWARSRSGRGQLVPRHLANGANTTCTASPLAAARHRRTRRARRTSPSAR